MVSHTRCQTWTLSTNMKLQQSKYCYYGQPQLPTHKHTFQNKQFNDGDDTPRFSSQVSHLGQEGKKEGP